MLRTRVITATILTALLLLGLFLLPPRGIEITFGLVFTVAAWEWAGFGALRSSAARGLYALCMALLMLAGWHLTAGNWPLLWVLGGACVWWLLALLWLALAPMAHRPQLALLCGVPVLVPAFLALAHLQASEGAFASGPAIVLWLIGMVCAADIGAYFVGRRFGRTKLSPRVSPGKTWEGAVGGAIAVALVAWCGALYFHLPLLHAVGFGCLLSVFSVIGDLTESMFKRAAGLKDSGALLPGHGGLLDRIDSVTAAAPLYALGLFGSGVLP